MTAPTYSPSHPVVDYIKADKVIIADLGDRGQWHEANWLLTNWIERVLSEGYALLFAGLVHEECKHFIEDAAEKIAKTAKVGVERIIEWPE